MSQEIQTLNQSQADNVYLAIGAGLAVASMILVPAMAVKLGLGSSLTGALRIALMKASTRATSIACSNSGCVK